ncbi:hypothetical protein SAMD00019534_056460 [Acytostelium subglobosum LB1]|uniref:hypothetical protein n=1 Tax=Acytostelium subglobosum LB1 TaxID=1410327 RepID=UPI00064486C7|nr:hypothetical protein SAMD00019534_056460 [Acytostelium subglobosum LB1]GAM22471.1 hypothetical protein SAMD00019534_056460 [Acytostelium subglobosum LB1]|eukprot:XP_012754591.1 hypothetical protein SAMD00019534_056460 [Acytostelium subglobosum LB1]
MVDDGVSPIKWRVGVTHTSTLVPRIIDSDDVSKKMKYIRRAEVVQYLQLVDDVREHCQKYVAKLASLTLLFVCTPAEAYKRDVESRPAAEFHYWFKEHGKSSGLHKFNPDDGSVVTWIQLVEIIVPHKSLLQFAAAVINYKYLCQMRIGGTVDSWNELKMLIINRFANTH